MADNSNIIKTITVNNVTCDVAAKYDGDGNNIKSTYLTSCGAVSTYLSKTDAANTYLTKTEAAGMFLTTSGANNTYLSKTDASSTYLTKSSAEGLYLTVSDAVNTYLSKTGAAGIYLTTSGASSTYLSKTDAESTYIKRGTGSAITKTSSFVNITYEDGFLISNDYSHVLITVIYSQVDDERPTAELEIDWGGSGNFCTLYGGSMLPGATFEILSGGGSYYLICKDYQGKTIWSGESDDLYLEFNPSESFQVIVMTEVF